MKPMVKKMKIKVTRADIRTGLHAATDCPIFLACKRACAPVTAIGVKLSYYGDHAVLPIRESTPLSRSATRFVNRFDSNKPVKPFAFMLRLP